MAKFEKCIWFTTILTLVMSLIIAVAVNVMVDSVAYGQPAVFAVDIHTIPANTGEVAFDVIMYSDFDVVNVSAGQHSIVAQPDPGYVFIQWDWTGDINVPNPTLANTTCDVSGNGTLTMVQKLGADLEIEKDATDQPVTNGDEIHYHIDLSNDGPSKATGVKVIDTLPPGVTFLSANPNTGVYGGGTYTWDLGDMAANNFEEFGLNVIVDASTPPGPLTNTAAVSSETYDPNEIDNTSKWVIEVVANVKGVGGEVISINKFMVLIPWLALATLITAGGVILVLRRRKGS